MTKAFPESADALDDNFELDTGLVATDDEEDSRVAESSSTRRAAGTKGAPGPSSGRSTTAPAASVRPDIGEEEDEFALEDDDDDDANEDEENGRQSREDSMEQDEYGLPVGPKPAAPSRKRNADELNGGGEPGDNAPLSKEEKKRRRKEKTKEAKVGLLSFPWYAACDVVLRLTSIRPTRSAGKRKATMKQRQKSTRLSLRTSLHSFKPTSWQRCRRWHFPALVQ